MNIILKGLKATTKFLIGTFAAGTIVGLCCVATATGKTVEEVSDEGKEGLDELMKEFTPKENNTAEETKEETTE